MNNFRKWLTARYDGSAWVRLTFVAAMVFISVVIALLLGYFIKSAWLSAIATLFWLLALSIFATWITTWHDCD